MKSSRTLAFDIGGTKIASALVEIGGGDYKILDYKKDETPRDAKEVVAKILLLADFYKGKYDFKKIGLAMAGQINAAGDTIISSPNIAGFSNFRLGKMVGAKTSCEVSIKNDVHCFALGEDRFGKYQGYDNAIFLAVGTGVGGAIKTNGKFYFGKDNIAGEFGHMVIEKDGEKCKCGRKGCWERYVAGPGVEKMYEEMCGEKKGAKDIVYDAVRGEEKDQAVMLRASSYFAIGLANIVNVLNPEIVIIGGSMVKEKKLLKFAMPFIKNEVLPSARKMKVVNSSLGDDAFLLGAVIE
ncbi:MAG: ROK family protein [Candidatus Paceibacterota bacterium]